LQGLALAERIEAQLPQLVAKFAAARLPDTLPASLARLRAALPQPLRAALVMTCDECAARRPGESPSATPLPSPTTIFTPMPNPPVGCSAASNRPPQV